MYREIEPPTTFQIVVFSAATAGFSGGVYAWTLAPLGPAESGLLGGFFRSILGLILSPAVVPILRDASLGSTTAIAGLPTIIVGNLLGLVDTHLVLAILIEAVVFVSLCLLAARLAPATRPITPFIWENCGYALTGVLAPTCPECGRERIIAPISTPKDQT
jgi:hypothetical protein